MYVIILAAGQSKRFQEAGIDIPKPFLEIDYRGTSVYMIQHVINTIPLKFREIHIAAPPGTEFNAPGIWVSGIMETKGPADTALQMIRVLGDYDTGAYSSYLILDCDVLNFTNDLEGLSESLHCGVLVSWSANPAYSYVDKLGSFNRIEEKQRISEYAVRGAYFIHESAYNEFINISKLIIEAKQEPYLSHVFNAMQCEKLAIETSYLPVDWGTPRDLRISGAHIVPQKGRT
jgi:molybdopterin-guanine dinucleotide biosynthesis protein A